LRAPLYFPFPKGLQKIPFFNTIKYILMFK
jgi:hypothetical protein